MTGQTIRGGTAFADILLDEVAVMRLQKNLPPVGAMDFEEEAPTEDEINTELEYDPNDICSTTRLKMNMAMPKSNVMIDEDDVELVEIQTTGEE